MIRARSGRGGGSPRWQPTPGWRGPGSTIFLVRAGVILGIVIGVIVVVMLLVTLIGRRRGYSGMGGDTIVRCSKGHLFTTIWVPGVSFKSVRLGYARFQHCPV